MRPQLPPAGAVFLVNELPAAKGAFHSHRPRASNQETFLLGIFAWPPPLHGVFLYQRLEPGEPLTWSVPIEAESMMIV